MNELIKQNIQDRIEARAAKKRKLMEDIMNKYILGKQKTLAELCQKKDKQIEFLWSLLDDISTAGDVFKPKINAYFKYVNDRCEKRGEIANSEDGYTLKIKGLYGS